MNSQLCCPFNRNIYQYYIAIVDYLYINNADIIIYYTERMLDKNNLNYL